MCQLNTLRGLPAWHALLSCQGACALLPIRDLMRAQAIRQRGGKEVPTPGAATPLQRNNTPWASAAQGISENI